MPGYELAVWYGALGPKGMDPELVSRLNKEINAVLAKPDVIKKMNDMAVELRQGTPEAFAALLERDAKKYGDLVQQLGIKAE